MADDIITHAPSPISPSNALHSFRLTSEQANNFALLAMLYFYHIFVVSHCEFLIFFFEAKPEHVCFRSGVGNLNLSLSLSIWSQRLHLSSLAGRAQEFEARLRLALDKRFLHCRRLD